MPQSKLGRRDFFKSAGMGAAAAGMMGPASRPAQAAAAAGPERPPNFVIIFTDDQGYADTGCFGAEGYETPNLDRMCAEGMQFTNFYSVAPSCSPSRASLMTGCYPARVGIPGVLNPSSKTGIHADEITLAELLKPLGYATACYGKWHLGHHPEFLPTRHGFDDYFGLPYSNDMWPKHPQHPEKYPPLPLVEGEAVIEQNPDQTQLTTWYTERSVKFIEKNKDQPFFLYLPHSMPHVPLHVSGKFKGKSKQGMYGDVIMEIDWSVGRILDTLEEHGLAENTLVVFSSDNGPWLSYGNHAGSAGPLREGKGTTFDGGQREPTFAWWPGHIPAGSVCHEVGANFDWLPTFAALAGADLPHDRVIDGRNIWPLLAGGENATSPHEAFFFIRGNNVNAVREGPWKLHVRHKYRSLVHAGNDGEPGKYEYPMIEKSLFNLEEDIGEENDLLEKHPDIAEHLEKRIELFRKDLDINSRPPGHV